jgi:hypothetical protein
MPDQEQHIDLVSLQEVERLLNETRFATIDDLIGRGGVQPLTSALAASSPRAASPAGNSDGLAPLPRRR